MFHTTILGFCNVCESCDAMVGAKFAMVGKGGSRNVEWDSVTFGYLILLSAN